MVEHGKWGGIIEGHAFDLADWIDGLPEPHDPWVELWTVADTVHHVLRSREIEAAPNIQEAYERAGLLVAKLNGAFAARSRSETITLRGVADKLPDGTVTQMIVMAAGSIRGRARLSAIPDRNASTPPPASAVQTWLRLVDQNTLADDLLMHQSKPANWYDLYKSFEDVRKLCGGENLLKKRNWCPSGGELNSFTHTANYYRHSLAHPARSSPPEKPMQLNQASEMIRAMVVGVLTDLVAEE